ncbi:MAG: type IV secretory system conjugative DNA transfer family protein [Clostridia bacterium]|nr:type IV secretory system conjugative DNA transfer family protein [Clostridia bacterium]
MWQYLEQVEVKNQDGYVIPNILNLAQQGKSMILTDPKGELYKKTYLFLKEQGYNVKLFNLVDMDKSDRWNPFSIIESEIDAQLFSEIIIENTQLDKNKGQDEFWTRTAQNLLNALSLGQVELLKNREDRCISKIYATLSTGDIKAIDRYFVNIRGPGRMSYNIYAQATDAVKQSVVTGLATRLQLFQTKKVRRITDRNDIDLRLPGQEKCAYFCVTSDMDGTFDFIASLFFSFLFIKLIRLADSNENGKLDVETYFLLDEFPNIGKIPDFEKKLSTMRSRGVNTSIIFQSIAQLKNRYPNDVYQEILGNCDTKICLGCSEMLTSEYVSKLLGTSTVETSTINKENGFDGNFTYGKESKGATRRNLLNPDELIGLDNTKEIVILRGKKPLMCDKFDYSEHELSKCLKMLDDNYIPEWRKGVD